MMAKKILFITLLIAVLTACKNNIHQQELYLGADLSYVNEILDFGGKYRLNNEVVDPYELFAAKGANIVRVRLWNNPDWTNYSNYEDVKRTIAEAKKNKMKVLLDFHYSDTWADPHHQIIPKAWEHITDKAVLGDSLYNYTYQILYNLFSLNLFPEFVQVGNETNNEILMQLPYSEDSDPINWNRNAYLLNRGLAAVRDVSKKVGQPIQSMLHIAQPENALWWFEKAHKNNILDYDWIALSYYPKWSEYGLDKLELALDSLKKTYNKRIMIVETAYPYGFSNVDSANNILAENSLIEGYPATPKGQLDFMNKLVEVSIKGGAEGVIYWEPAWISSEAKTLWGQGSHWENATFFDADNNNEALPAFDFLSYSNKK